MLSARILRLILVIIVLSLLAGDTPKPPSTSGDCVQSHSSPGTSTARQRQPEI